ncbi:hypothetical protein LXH13_20860 [Streptomyces spinosirectus]|jgi:hypothetical protein|uniref:hypothetical protein n=1 Tax=Streptomyces TaxID=1883 RepID=UPI001C9DBC87|nr:MULTISPECIES: hypothetical protein [Streptomyces]MBY8346080.1 hypothetical protein [Streptomyces plumbidurans]UIR19348.1 hypothetical protein LXH13_20860 [Streptomyces spinosirectus]
MIEGMDHLPTTEAAVTALRALADEYAREIEVDHDIGADRTSRRSAAGVGVTADPDGSLPHEAHVEFGGLPRVSVRLYADDDALITVEGVECPDVDRDDVPAFVRSLFDDRAFVKSRRFPPARFLIVPLPQDRTHREYVRLVGLGPWLSSRVR